MSSILINNKDTPKIVNFEGAPASKVVCEKDGELTRVFPQDDNLDVDTIKVLWGLNERGEMNGYFMAPSTTLNKQTLYSNNNIYSYSIKAFSSSFNVNRDVTSLSFPVYPKPQSSNTQYDFSHEDSAVHSHPFSESYSLTAKVMSYAEDNLYKYIDTSDFEKTGIWRYYTRWYILKSGTPPVPEKWEYLKTDPTYWRVNESSVNPNGYTYWDLGNGNTWGSEYGDPDFDKIKSDMTTSIEYKLRQGNYSSGYYCCRLNVGFYYDVSGIGIDFETAWYEVSCDIRYTAGRPGIDTLYDCYSYRVDCQMKMPLNALFVHAPLINDLVSLENNRIGFKAIKPVCLLDPTNINDAPIDWIPSVEYGRDCGAINTGRYSVVLASAGRAGSDEHFNKSERILLHLPEKIVSIYSNNVSVSEWYDEPNIVATISGYDVMKNEFTVTVGVETISKRPLNIFYERFDSVGNQIESLPFESPLSGGWSNLCVNMNFNSVIQMGETTMGLLDTSVPSQYHRDFIAAQDSVETQYKGYVPIGHVSGWIREFELLDFYQDSDGTAFFEFYARTFKGFEISEYQVGHISFTSTERIEASSSDLGEYTSSEYVFNTVLTEDPGANTDSTKVTFKGRISSSIPYSELRSLYDSVRQEGEEPFLYCHGTLKTKYQNRNVGQDEAGGNHRYGY